MLAQHKQLTWKTWLTPTSNRHWLLWPYILPDVFLTTKIMSCTVRALEQRCAATSQGVNTGKHFFDYWEEMKVQAAYTMGKKYLEKMHVLPPKATQTEPNDAVVACWPLRGGGGGVGGEACGAHQVLMLLVVGGWLRLWLCPPAIHTNCGCFCWTLAGCCCDCVKVDVFAAAALL